MRINCSKYSAYKVQHESARSIKMIFIQQNFSIKDAFPAMQMLCRIAWFRVDPLR